LSDTVSVVQHFPGTGGKSGQHLTVFHSMKTAFHTLKPAFQTLMAGNEQKEM